MSDFSASNSHQKPCVRFVDNGGEYNSPGYNPTSSPSASGSASQQNPPSLDFLKSIDKLMVDQNIRQQRNLLSLSARREKYHRIMDNNGQVLCNALATYTYEIFKAEINITFSDNNGVNFMRIQRARGFLATSFQVFLENTYLGSVNQKLLALKACFEVRDPWGRIIYKITVPNIFNKTAITLKIHRADGAYAEVGEIIKQFHWFTGIMSTPDVFYMTFSDDSIDVRHKALLLAAGFYIDFACYERYRTRNYPSL